MFQTATFRVHNPSKTKLKKLRTAFTAYHMCVKNIVEGLSLLPLDKLRALDNIGIQQSSYEVVAKLTKPEVSAQILSVSQVN